MAEPILVVVTGPECSGKSTLSCALSKALKEPWVPEYAVEYLDGMNRPYHSEDLVKIAREQIKRIEATRLDADKVIIADTGLEVIEVWHGDKLGPLPKTLKEMRAQWQPDLYLLCRPDIPYEPHPLREDEHRRDELFEWYQNLLSNAGYAVIEGEQPQRMELALLAIQKILNH